MKYFERLLPLSFLIVFFSTDSLFAQQYTLKGQVTNTENKPVEFMQVNLFRNDKLQGTITTDRAGVFSFQIEKGNYKLVLERFGTEYYQQNLDFSENRDLGKIEINESILLEGVTITGNRKIVERKFDKVIFNVSNTPLKEGYNGLEVLKRSPGLRINSQGNILLRNENVMIMVNGRKMNFSAADLENYLSSLNSENIKSIEIQSLGSAETDASSTGGIVNIVLKKVPVGFQSVIKTSYAYRDKNHAGYTGGITNQFGAEKWNIYNKINYSDNSNLSRFNSVTNFYTSQGRNENYGTSDNHNKNFNTTTGVFFYPSKQHEIGAEIYYSNSKVNREGSENLRIYDPSHSSTSLNQSLYNNKNNLWNVTLNYIYKLNDKGSSIKFIGDAGNNKVDNNNEVDTKYIYGTLSDNYFRYLTDASSNFVNLQTDWVQKMDKNWELTIGTKYAQVSRNNQFNVFEHENGQWNPSSGDQDFENKEHVWSNYISIAKQWKQRHNLKVGLRTEYTNLYGTDYVNLTKVKRNYFDWFPNIYYGYTITDKQNISVAYARRITRPSFRDLNPFVIKQNDFLYQTGNPDLQPQYTNKIDISYNLSNHTFALFGSFSDDLIAGVYSVKDNVTYYKPQNFGKSRMIGLTHSYNGNLSKWLYTSISSGAWYYDFEIGNASHHRFSYYSTLSIQVKFDKTFFLDITNDYTSKSQNNAVEFYNQYALDLALQKSVFQGAGIIRIAWDDIFNTQRERNISKYENFDFHFYQKRITSYPTVTFTYNLKNNSKVNNKNIQKGNDNMNRL